MSRIEPGDCVRIDYEGVENYSPAMRKKIEKRFSNFGIVQRIDTRGNPIVKKLPARDSDRQFTFDMNHVYPCCIVHNKDKLYSKSRGWYCPFCNNE